MSRPRGTPWPRRLVRAGGAAAAAAAVLHTAPMLTSIAPLRIRAFPHLSGLGHDGHVALTFDDGPDAKSTPRFLDELARHDVRATFFLLGSMLSKALSLGRDLVDAGHEVAVHGWDHRNLVGRSPRATHDDLARARDLITDTTGTSPRLFRPPYGVLTTSALLAARDLGLQPVLWTAWGKDWAERATPDSVLRNLERGILRGGTILLHDSDCTSAPGAWHSALGALPRLVAHCTDQGLRMGPLREHGNA
jgi:peptidoglycan/xylan/chitin deacetylase (PgdA/CDA1 family)